MSFEDIRAASITRLATILSTYKEIKNPFDLEDNEERTLVKGYAVRFGEGQQAQGETRKLRYSSNLRVGLTKGLSVRISDSEAPDIGTIYADVETVLASFFNDTFLGIPEKLQGFTSSSIAKPKKFGGNEFVVIWITMVASHKLNINYS